MGKIDLVDDRHKGQSLGEGEVEIGNCLRLHALASIDEEEGCRLLAYDKILELVDAPPPQLA
jgi:hypothetical protein